MIKSVMTASPAVKNDLTVAARINALWPAHTQALAELLIALRRDFEGDLDALLILLVISIGTESQNWEQVLDGSIDGKAGRPTNTTSLAEITGIPRESVRRKATKLVERGLLARGSRGDYLLEDNIALRFETGTSAARRYLERIARALQTEG